MVLTLACDENTKEVVTKQTCQEDCINIEDIGMAAILDSLGYVINQGLIKRETVESIDSLNLRYFSSQEIKSYSDLKYFKNLKYLSLMDYGFSDSLDLSNNSNLERIEVSKFYAGYSPGFKLINITQCLNLEILGIYYSVQPVSGIANLEFSKIENLDLSKYKKLQELHISGCNIKNLNFSYLENLSALELKQAYGKDSLDLTNNTKLNRLYILYSDDIKAVCLDPSAPPISDGLWSFESRISTSCN